MPLIKSGTDVEELNSFLDVAITGEGELNPLVNVSRVQNVPSKESNEARSLDSTAWRSKNRGSELDTSCIAGKGTENIVTGMNEEICTEYDTESCAGSRHSGRTFGSKQTKSVISENTIKSCRDENNNNTNPTPSVNCECESIQSDVNIVNDEKNSNHDFTNEDAKGDCLEQEIAKISFELADSQAQVDWFKMKYRHLEVEFNDLQAFCKQLQNENMELRCENEQLRNGEKVAAKKRSTWFKSPNLMRLTKPKSIKEPRQNADDSDCEDWDDDTLTTQFCESSRISSFFGDDRSKCSSKSGSFKRDKKEDKPDNIVFGGKHEGEKGSSLLGLEEKLPSKQGVDDVAEVNREGNCAMDTPKKMMRRRSDGAALEDKARFYDRNNGMTSMMRRKGDDEETKNCDPSSNQNRATDGVQQKMFSIQEDCPPEQSTQRAYSAGQFEESKPKMFPIKEDISGKSSNRSKSEDNLTLDTNGWSRKEATEEMSEGSIDEKSWWNKMNIKKPFGQMQIAAMKNTADMNSSLRDINLDQSERRFTSEDLYESGTFDESFCTYGGRDLSEYSNASVSNTGYYDSSSNLQGKSKGDYSDFCNRMAKRKGLHS